MTVGYISQIERGFTKVNLETRSKIAEVLGCEMSDFLEGTTERNAAYLADVVERLTPANKKILLEISESLLRNQGVYGA